jgi:hypothetical protein
MCLKLNWFNSDLRDVHSCHMLDYTINMMGIMKALRTQPVMQLVS